MEPAEVRVFEGDCSNILDTKEIKNVTLTFVDPPFRQGKEYRFFDDNQPEVSYWGLIEKVLHQIYLVTVEGGSIYFMQREKNVVFVMEALRKTGWTFQNLIVWKKRTSAVPGEKRFAKQYQIIVFATKGRPKTFNKLRVDLPLLPGQKIPRQKGVYLTDVWDDIKELTAGYFAGEEALRNEKGERVHAQQSPVALLLRIILSSTLPGDMVLDPFAGTGTTLVVAKQLKRSAIGIEIDPENVRLCERRLRSIKPADDISQYRHYYRFTENLEHFWPQASNALDKFLPSQ
jgi:DNA modification methylase